MGGDTFLIDMGKRIAQRRKELHLTQEQLAEKMGVSLQTVSCIELGKKAIRPENLANLCTCLTVTADVFHMIGEGDFILDGFHIPETCFLMRFDCPLITG